MLNKKPPGSIFAFGLDKDPLPIFVALDSTAYREMLAIEDELKTYAQGGGLMDTIPEHLEEVKRRIDGYADMKAACAKAAQAPYDDDELPF